MVRRPFWFWVLTVLLVLFPRTLAVASSSPLPPLSVALFADSRDGCLGGPGLLFCTSDGGRSWHPIYHGAATPEAVVWSRGHVSLLLAGDRLLSASRGHWQPVSRWRLINIGRVGPRLVGLTASHRLVLSRDGGVQWSLLPLSPVTTLSVQAGVARVITRHGWMYRSSSGLLWDRVGSLPSLPGFHTEQIAFANQQDGWVLAAAGSVCVYSQPYLVYATRDGGRAWNPILKGTSSCWAGPSPKLALAPEGFPLSLTPDGRRDVLLAVGMPAESRLTVVEVGAGGVLARFSVTGGTGLLPMGAVAVAGESRTGWLVTAGVRGAGVIFRLSRHRHHWTVEPAPTVAAVFRKG
jgi:hypothetical protein